MRTFTRAIGAIFLDMTFIMVTCAMLTSVLCFFRGGCLHQGLRWEMFSYSGDAQGESRPHRKRNQRPGKQCLCVQCIHAERIFLCITLCVCWRIISSLLGRSQRTYSVCKQRMVSWCLMTKRSWRTACFCVASLPPIPATIISTDTSPAAPSAPTANYHGAGGSGRGCWRLGTDVSILNQSSFLFCIEFGLHLFS